MRLVRYGPAGQEKPGVMDQDGVLRKLPDSLSQFANAGQIAELVSRAGQLDTASMPKVTTGPRIGSPLEGVGKLICVGLNYRDHAAEADMPIPAEPVLFMKATTAICGPNDAIVLPRGYSKVDWEVELGVVIGKEARYVRKEDAYEYVVGYCLAHDVSERVFQLERGGQWLKGKSFDTFAPLGPWLVSQDEIPDPHSLNIWLKVNGVQRQNSNTSSMIFGVADIVSYISHVMTLKPGDVLLTGTPAGVAMGRKPPVYLQPGDKVCLGIDGLGVQEQVVIEPPVAA